MDPNEEEQLRLMQEQQAEIEKLKAQLVSNQPTAPDSEIVVIPDPQQLAMSFQETVWLSFSFSVVVIWRPIK